MDGARDRKAPAPQVHRRHRQFDQAPAAGQGHPDRLRRTVAAPGPASHDDTNLAPIMAYFNAGPPDGIDFITFQDWFNCNTVEDYRQVRDYLHKGKTHV